MNFPRPAPPPLVPGPRMGRPIPGGPAPFNPAPPEVGIPERQPLPPMSLMPPVFGGRRPFKAGFGSGAPAQIGGPGSDFQGRPVTPTNIGGVLPPIFRNARGAFLGRQGDV